MRNKLIALVLGILCHLSFCVAILLMAYMLFEGLTKSLVPVTQYGRYVNFLLLIQFPLLHSFLLSKKGRMLLELPFPKGLGRDLSTTTYGLIASLQLIAVFLFWTPNQQIWFVPTGVVYYLSSLLYLLSWGLLLKALGEAGLAMHTGYLGWSAVFAGRKPEYPNLCSKGLHNCTRHPIYLAFSLIILTAPVWSFDHFVLAAVWVSYCVFGPLLKEKRMLKRYGEEYRQRQNKIPYLIPKLPFI